jgi:RNA polymerase sigma factor (sigma-70 family)
MNRPNTAPPTVVSQEPLWGDLLESTFARFQDELLGMLYHLLGNREDARDALQDAFLKCWRRREEVGRIDNLRAWVFRVALNAGRDLRGTAWRRRRKPLPEFDEAAPVERALAPEKAAVRNEELAMVRQALRALRPEEQEVFLLRQNGDLTYEEIGDALQLPVGTIKTRMRLALEKLRKRVPAQPDV